MVEALPPGLFEMEIVDKGKKEGLSDYDVRFVERDIADLMALNEDKTEMAEEDADFAPGCGRLRDQRQALQHVRRPLGPDISPPSLRRRS